jgi:hypothetical protein
LQSPFGFGDERFLGIGDLDIEAYRELSYPRGVGGRLAYDTAHITRAQKARQVLILIVQLVKTAGNGIISE